MNCRQRESKRRYVETGYIKQKQVFISADGKSLKKVHSMDGWMDGKHNIDVCY